MTNTTNMDGEAGRVLGQGQDPHRGRRNAIELRRCAVERCMVENRSVRATVDLLAEDGIVASRGTVGNDMIYLRLQWRARAHLEYDAVVAEEIRKLDLVEQSILPQVWDNPIGALHAWVEVAQRRAKLLGLDRPTRVEAKIEVSDYRQRTDDELEALLRGGAAELLAAEEGNRAEAAVLDAISESESESES